jgi:membrane protease YdiL (CAAX protease family)
MADATPRRRLWIYLATTFLITWGAWWTLARLADLNGLTFGRPAYMTLFLLGGFGPTIAALIAVAVTPAEGALREYAGRLINWRVSPWWWLVALILPFVMTDAAVLAATAAAPALAAHVKIAPLTGLVTLFPTMIIGGGLEELGWRGVAQPELERRLPRLAATAIIAATWAIWHLPLFFLAGAGQHGQNFAAFAMETAVNAFLLAWLYANTRSILLCILFHAAMNSATSLGLYIPAGRMDVHWTIWSLELAVGVALVASTTVRRRADSGAPA